MLGNQFKRTSKLQDMDSRFRGNEEQKSPFRRYSRESGNPLVI